MTTAVTIDGEKYTTGEVSYYYQTAYRNFLNNYSSVVSYLGLNPSASLKDQALEAGTASMLGIQVPVGGALRPGGQGLRRAGRMAPAA